MREAAAFDRSLWVVTDQHIHKQVEDGCRTEACSKGGCCYSCFSCAEPLKGSDSGKIALDKIVDVDTYGDNFADTCCCIVPPGSWCCATDYVAVQVPRGHLLAHEGYTPGGQGRIRCARAEGGGLWRERAEGGGLYLTSSVRLALIFLARSASSASNW